MFAPMFAARGGRWFSLQVGGDAAAQLAAIPAVARPTDLAPHLVDYASTAAALAMLDELVSVDTSVAHLAGALGVPTTLILPACADWRWGRHLSTTPWYPRMRIERAPHLPTRPAPVA
jgi:ADP-heptose:LPS heptosyltransferase